MSVQAMANVWANSRQSGGNLLLLLALADFANDLGECWPSVETLAAKARVTERHARRIIRELESTGEIEIRAGGGRNRVNVYVIKSAVGRNPDKKSPRRNPDTRVRESGLKTLTPASETLTPVSGNQTAETLTPASETLTPASVNPDAGVSQTIKNHQEPPSGEKGTTDLEADAAAFVDWFLDLLQKTGARVPKLTDATRDAWADAYEKLVRIDGRTKKEIARVCRWAREDSFWRSNFLSPMKLRHKNRDGVAYFDVFANRMHQPPTHEKDQQRNSRSLGTNSNLAALEEYQQRLGTVAADA